METLKERIATQEALIRTAAYMHKRTGGIEWAEKVKNRTEKLNQLKSQLHDFHNSAQSGDSSNSTIRHDSDSSRL